jgi:DNA adenine methylase
MWAGGKNKMLPKYEVTPGIPKSGYDTYVEPFFGGGAMMIYLAQHAPGIKRFVLNDINPEIVALYRAIKTDVNGFMHECDQHCAAYLPLAQADRKRYYYATRQSYITDYASWSPIKESATLYFLMKTAFNGIFQSTKEAKGRFCTPSGLLNHKGSVYDRNNVIQWNQFLQRVDIFNGDWQHCLEVSDRAFYFFDPPYRGSFTQYAQTFTDQDHTDVIDFCRRADQADHLVFFAGRDTNDDFYTSRQGDLGLAKYPITYTAGRRSTAVKEDGSIQRKAKSATEILLYSKSVSTYSSFFDD